MAKKSHEFNEKSNKQCAVKGCKRILKKRNAEAGQTLCFGHYMEFIRKNPAYVNWMEKPIKTVWKKVKKIGEVICE